MTTIILFCLVQLEENQVELQNDKDTLSSSEPAVVNIEW